MIRSWSLNSRNTSNLDITAGLMRSKSLRNLRIQRSFTLGIIMCHSWVERTRSWTQFWSVIVTFHAIKMLQLLSISHRNFGQSDLNIGFFEFMSIFGCPILTLHDLIRIYFAQILWIIVSSANQKSRFLIDFFTKVCIDLYRLTQRVWFSFRLFYSRLERISRISIVDNSCQTWIQIAISVFLLVEKNSANI